MLEILAITTTLTMDISMMTTALPWIVIAAMEAADARTVAAAERANLLVCWQLADVPCVMPLVIAISAAARATLFTTKTDAMVKVIPLLDPRYLFWSNCKTV